MPLPLFKNSYKIKGYDIRNENVGKPKVMEMDEETDEQPAEDIPDP